MIEGAKRTLRDHLIETGQASPEPCKCPVCGYSRHPVELIELSELPDEPMNEGYICSHCIAERTAVMARFANVINADEHWNDIKGKRNLLLDQYAWTVRADSPLTPLCKATFLVFLQKLHKISVDFAEPTEVVFPAVPDFKYQ